MRLALVRAPAVATSADGVPAEGGRATGLTGRTDRPKGEAEMADQHKPGEIVKTSGIYKVVKEGRRRAGIRGDVRRR